MKTGCKYCDESPPNPEQPGLYCLPHSEHAASESARRYFEREDERCRVAMPTERERILMCGQDPVRNSDLGLKP